MTKPQIRLLIIEDSEDDAKFYETCLREDLETEYAITFESTGAEGIAAAKQRTYDCILVDYHLPDVTGLDVIDDLYSGEFLPLVMITGRGDERIAVQALKRGAADYLVKSDVTPGSIYRAVNTTVDRARFAERLRLQARQLAREQTEKSQSLEREALALLEARRHRQRLELFFAKIPTPIAILSGNSLVFEVVNESFERLMPALYASEIITLPMILGQEVRAIAKLVGSSGRPFQSSELAIERDWEHSGNSSVRHFNITVDLVPELGASAPSLLLMLNDVSDHVQARRLVEESERRALEGEIRFRQLSELLPDLVVVTDSDMGGEYFNQTFLALVGVGDEALMGEGWFDFVHPSDRPQLRSVGHKVGRARALSATFRLKTGGSDAYRWFTARLLGIEDARDHVHRIYICAADTHDERLLTENLRESEERLNRACAASQVGIWELDLRTGEFWRNLEHDRLFGYQQAKAEWSVQSFLEHLSPEDRDGARALFDQALAAESSFSLEARVQWPDQSRHWLKMRGQVSRGVNNSARMVGTLIETTSAKLHEQALTVARAAAESASRSKSDFLANMSHEIRTPLNAIIGFTQLLTSDEVPPSQKAEYAATVHRNSNNLMQIIDDVLDLSKIEAGKVDLFTEDVDLRRLIDELCQLFGPRAEERGLNLSARVDANLTPMFKTDATRLRQILANALSNAIKFTPRGRVELAVEPLDVDAPGSGIRFLIRDTGIGMADSVQKNLFRAFSQGDSSMSRHYGGTGLGLMLSRKLADLLGGQFYLAHTEVGRGSTFALEVPPNGDGQDLAVVPALRRVVTEPESNAPRSLNAVRVVLVDDSEDSRYLSQLCLESAGAEVQAFCDSVEALEHLRAHGERYHAIVTDIQMPRLDGYELTRILRKANFIRPIIGLTAHAFEEDRQRSFKSGLDAHVVKPFRPSDLIGALAECLSTHASSERASVIDH